MQRGLRRYWFFPVSLALRRSALKVWIRKRRKDDWEEINFEFNSSVLSDGFPSLLRLAELLRNILATKSRSKATPTLSAADPTTKNSARRGPIRCATSW